MKPITQVVQNKNLADFCNSSISTKKQLDVQLTVLQHKLAPQWEFRLTTLKLGIQRIVITQ